MIVYAIGFVFGLVVFILGTVEWCPATMFFGVSMYVYCGIYLWKECDHE